MTKNKKVLFSPILQWREDEVWQYIEDKNIPVNPCYENSGRVGCLFCPFASKRALLYACNQYPRYYKLFMRTIQRIIDVGYLDKYQPLTAEEVFEWWISKQNAKVYFSQTKLEL